MSYSSIEIVNVLNQTIANSVLMSDAQKPNGSIYKDERPAGSLLEDLVVLALSFDREDVQQGVLKLNIYVPNLVFPDRPEDKYLPDTVRMLYLSRLANTALGEGEEIWDPSGKFCFEILMDKIEHNETREHYVSFDIQFYAIN